MMLRWMSDVPENRAPPMASFPERLAEYALALGALFLARWLYARFLRAPFVRTIRWTGTTLRLHRGGRVTPL